MDSEKQITSKYFAKIVESFEFSPGGWKGAKIGVFEVEGAREIQIGEYQRNYGGFYNTFFYFQQNGKDFALYSPDYTVTRIMELPSCKDIGGEEPADMEFCPVDYFVPTFIDQEIVNVSTNDAFPGVRTSVVRINNPKPEVLTEFTSEHEYVNGNTGQKCKDTSTYRPLTPLLYYPFGFVAGCVWADDGSWKIQYLNLSEAERGIVKREERFGYTELPDKLRLKDAVEMNTYERENFGDYSNYVRINIMQTFDMRTGQRIDVTD